MRKWYYELPAILAVIAIGIAAVWNVNFNTAPVIDKKAVETTETFTVKRDTFYTQWRTGKDVFKSNCAACHNPKADGTGPALQGVTARWKAAGKFKGKEGEQWLKIWIRNFNEPVYAGYPYAVNMSNSRPSMMNVFPMLTDKDIDAILAYVENPDVAQQAMPNGAVR